MTSPSDSEKLKENLRGRSFLTLEDFSQAELMYFIKFAMELKNKQELGIPHKLLEGKTLAMIFEKSSTRTRVSFEVGMFQLGGHALFLSKNDIQMGRGETISDTAKVLSTYVDGIMIRTFKHDVVEELAEEGSIPIINGLTDDFHPCQIVGDLMTLYEIKGSFKGKKIAFIGDGNNVANSLLMGCAIMGIDCAIASPKGYQIDSEILSSVKEKAKATGAEIMQTTDPVEAVENADVIYTDVWTSMGWEDEKASRLEKFAGFQVNQELVKHAKADYSFFHCLPAHRGEEVTSSVIDGAHSVVYNEAENRLHAQKAILASLL